MIIGKLRAKNEESQSSGLNRKYLKLGFDKMKIEDQTKLIGLN